MNNLIQMFYKDDITNPCLNANADLANLYKQKMPLKTDQTNHSKMESQNIVCMKCMNLNEIFGYRGYNSSGIALDYDVSAV